MPKSAFWLANLGELEFRVAFISSVQSFQGADEFGNDFFATADAVGIRGAAVEPLMIMGCDAILPAQMERCSLLADESQNGFRQ